LAGGLSGVDLRAPEADQSVRPAVAQEDALPHVTRHEDFVADDCRVWSWVVDLGTGVMQTSAQFRRSLGLRPEDTLTIWTIGSFIHPDDQARREAALQRALAGGGPYEGEYRLVLKDGSIVWHHVQAQITRGADGAPLRMAGISFDITARRAAEHRLELSEESLRLAADAAEVGTWDLDLTTGALTWSDRTKAMFGISPDQPCTMDDFYRGLHKDDYEATAAAFASALDPAVRATYDVEYRTVGREDGVIRWVAAKGKGLFQDGVCRRAIGTAIDITARKRAAISQAFVLDLLDRLRRLRAPQDILNTAVAALGQHLGACRVGYAHVQEDGKTCVLETCHVDGVAPLQGAFLLSSFGHRNITRQREGHSVVIGDVEIDPDSDRETWAAIQTRAYVSVPLVRNGRLRATLFVNHRAPHAWTRDEVCLIEEVAGRIWDILERSRAEARLRQLNVSLERQVEQRTQALNRLWRLSPVLMVVGDPNGVLLEANPAWTDTLGWTPEETIGHDVMDFVAPEDRETGSAGMRQLIQGTPVVEYQLSFQTRSGDRRRIAWTTVPEDGRLYGFGRDITEQALAEERLRQAQKMEAVGQLTGGLAHDFNNLLAGITGSLEMMQLRVAQGRFGELDRYTGAAQAAARRAAALTQRLLAFSRRQTLDPRPTDINHLVAGMEELIRRTVGPALQIITSTQSDLWTTLVDPHQLENALLNLCINARDAMPDGGRLTIETANLELDAHQAQGKDLQPGPYVLLSVSDTGTGMTEEVMRRAFDPFFTTKPLGAGTGLGLSMTYGFVRQSGGQVRLSSAVGRGTQVRLYFPRHGAPAEQMAENGAPLLPERISQGETVLVVDDEATIRMLVTEVLNDLGYDALQAADGAAALRILESGARVDLLVTDVGLPGGMNGRQLADAGRTLRPGLRVLFITGYAETAAVGGAHLGAGMQVLTKPFQLEALTERIRGLVR
jgi:PAS domain S-box-containing protein